MRIKGFCGGSYQAQSPLADSERTINFYPENSEDTDSTTDMSLYPTPGVRVVTAGTISPGFAHAAFDGREFAVFGNQFVEISQAGVRTVRGAVTLGDTPATLSYNGKAGQQVLVTAGRNAYIYNTVTNAFTQVAALNGIATMGDMLDGYFLVMAASTSTWYFSNLNDGLTWNTGVNFVKRSAASDPWVALKVVGKFIWLLGSDTSEVWYDAGTFPLPFAPYAPTIIPFGCVAPFSPEVLNGVLFWVGSDHDILMASGFSPQVISTYGLSNVLTGYSTLADAVGDSYTSRGHGFYMASFLSGNVTHCYDMNTQLWHERDTWISEESRYTAWRPRFHAEVFNEHRMLDSSGSAVYTMEESVTTDVDERSIRRLRRSPCMYKDNERIFVDGLELEMEIGLGTSNAPADNPQVMLRQSMDGGKTWGIEHWRSAGKIGEYGKRVRWNRCGAGRRRVIEISTTDGIPWRILGMNAEVRQAPSGVEKFGQQQANG
jgi:hypothetical protein